MMIFKIVANQVRGCSTIRRKVRSLQCKQRVGVPGRLCDMAYGQTSSREGGVGLTPTGGPPVPPEFFGGKNVVFISFLDSGTQILNLCPKPGIVGFT